MLKLKTTTKSLGSFVINLFIFLKTSHSLRHFLLLLKRSSRMSELSLAISWAVIWELEQNFSFSVISFCVISLGRKSNG